MMQAILSYVGVLAFAAVVMSEVRAFVRGVIFAATWPKHTQLDSRTNGQTAFHFPQGISMGHRWGMCWRHWLWVSPLAHAPYALFNGERPRFNSMPAVAVGLIVAALSAMVGAADWQLIGFASLCACVTFASTEARGIAAAAAEQAATEARNRAILEKAMKG